MFFEDGRFLGFEFERQGVLLDKDSGNIFSLNATAWLVWRWKIQGAGDEEIRSRLMERFRIFLDQANETIRLCTSCVCDAPSRRIGLDDVEGHLDDGRLWVKRGKRTLGWLSEDTLEMGAEPGSKSDLLALCRYVVPKAIARGPALLLHGAAVSMGEACALFVGPSGAGKTTTAREISTRRKFQLVSEDKVLLEKDPSHGWLVWLEGEQFLESTARRLSEELGKNIRIRTNVSVGEIEGSNRSAVEAVFVLDESHRRALDHFGIADVDASEAVSTIATQMFKPPLPNWRDIVLTSREIQGSFQVKKLLVPASLSALENAILAEDCLERLGIKLAPG